VLQNIQVTLSIVNTRIYEGNIFDIICSVRYDKKVKLSVCIICEKTYVGEWRYSSTISYLANRHRWAARLTPWPTYSRWKSPEQMVNRGLSTPETYCDTGQKKRSLLLPAAIIKFVAVQPTLQPLHQKSVNREMTVANMYLRFQFFISPEFSINVYVMPQIPSSLKSTLKWNIWFKRKSSDRLFIRCEKRI